MQVNWTGIFGNFHDIKVSKLDILESISGIFCNFHDKNPLKILYRLNFKMRYKNSASNFKEKFEEAMVH